MVASETKEAVLISSFAQAKEKKFRRPYEVGIVVHWQMPKPKVALTNGSPAV
jgi:hypothetical protein